MIRTVADLQRELFSIDARIPVSAMTPDGTVYVIAQVTVEPDDDDVTTLCLDISRPAPR